eukprot:363401-Chlamydomonas_euryale.AAC.3
MQQQAPPPVTGTLPLRGKSLRVSSWELDRCDAVACLRCAYASKRLPAHRAPGRSAHHWMARHAHTIQ